MAIDRRKFFRMSSGSQVRLRRHKLSHEGLEQLQYRMKNLSYGGVFLETNMPLPINSLVELYIPVPGEENREIHALALVRWVCDESKERGMGVEFIKISDADRKTIEEWLQKAAGKIAVTPNDFEIFRTLVENPQTAKIMDHYFRNIGKTITLEAFAKAAGVGILELESHLGPFIKFEMVALNGEEMQIKRPTDNNLWFKIVKWSAKSFLG